MILKKVDSKKDFFNDHTGVDFLLVDFTIYSWELKPNFAVPILRIFSKENDSNLLGMSTYAVAYKIDKPDLIRVENYESVVDCCKNILNGSLNVYGIPEVYTKHIPEHVKAISSFVDQNERKSRLKKCVACDFFDKETKSCQACGCDLLKKTFIKKEKCPLEQPLWDEITEQQVEPTTKTFSLVQPKETQKGCGCNK